MRRPHLALVVTLLATACAAPSEHEEPAPLVDHASIALTYQAPDRFYYPRGMATTRLTRGTPDPSDDQTAVLVASSNFDLRYPYDGLYDCDVAAGTLISADAESSVGGGALTWLDSEGIASFGFEVAVADATTCPGGPPTALVVSQCANRVYRFGLNAATGVMTCGAGCEVSLGANNSVSDIRYVEVACGSTRHRAFVGYMGSPNRVGSIGPATRIVEADLDDPTAPLRTLDIGDGFVTDMAYERAGDRLWVATASAGQRALLHAVSLSDPAWTGASYQSAVTTFDLYPYAPGAELQAVEVGNAVAGLPTRLYVTARIYDVAAQASSGTRPDASRMSVLLTFDLTSGLDGRPVILLRQVIPLTGSAVEHPWDIALVARGSGRRDVVLASLVDEGAGWPGYAPGQVAAWDDDEETLMWTLGGFGVLPFQLTVDQPAPGAPAHVYAASFANQRVVRFALDPAAPSMPVSMETIGGLGPNTP